MIILGIDPGLARTGFGVINSQGNCLLAVDYGCISTEVSVKKEKRLKKIYQEIKKVIRKYKPELIVIEELFFAKNAKTAIKVGEARGVAILACGEAKCQITEMTPLQVKMYLTSYGRASKKQIQEMVKIRLSLDKKPTPDDTADALALAICGARLLRNTKKVRKYEK